MLVTQLELVIGYAALCWLGPAGGREGFSGRFNRVQVAGTDQALVAEDEALRAGVAEAGAAQVLAPRVWIKGLGRVGVGVRIRVLPQVLLTTDYSSNDYD